ncbi:MAG: cytochrome C, partial [Halobacteriovoraceae bacterium]|nr:cytochrome C [Halobacteriovoraceae bacterium]
TQSVFAVDPAERHEALLGTANDELLADEELKSYQGQKKTVAVHKVDPHAGVYSKSQFPSATQCATCHKEIFDEWKISSHAYASISPMFHKFENIINVLTSGSIQNFCMRCHASAGVTMNEDRVKPMWERPQVSREGITCITCHRINEEFGKVNGERRINPGDIHSPIFGTQDDQILTKVISNKDFYKVASNKNETGMKIHAKAIEFKTLGKSEFCMGCHQVAVYPGIKLEVVWDQYRTSPAHKKGTTCQECHMGKVPGMAGGYRTGPTAVLNGKPINPGRTRHNHVFYGPGYPYSHPGIFPYNPRAQKFKMQDWLKFNYRANWGKKDFESRVQRGLIDPKFPKEWDDLDDRIDARKVVNQNLKDWKRKEHYRHQIIENSADVDGPYFTSDLEAGEDLDFHFVVRNKNPGHNLPSGSLGAQPQLWLNVVVLDPSGKRIWESGHTDSVGDVLDLHSVDVQQGKAKHDDQLFNLQSRFLVTNVKGTDREFYLPVNFDIDQLPHIRQGNAPNTLLNHPAFVRMEQHSLPPLGERKAKYSVPSELMTKPGKYKVAVRFRSRPEPIYFMKFVGATNDMIRTVNEWIGDSHKKAVVIEIKKP